MNIEQLKTIIADRAAVSDIECFCNRRLVDGLYWYDLASADRYARPWVVQAAAYLKLRGRLLRQGTEVRIGPVLAEVA